ncbi:MAG: polysaccharide deacetylase family protein, partial [Candidatus Caldatribacteriota bacterium]|nr:polysaccharide deacetylase family protein [Candidatus Caldatribacteriota bacterium]
MFSVKNKRYFFISKLILIFLFLTICQIILLSPVIVWAQETVIPILTYHNFTKGKSSSYQINIDKFEKQMDYLSTHNYSVISLSELIKGQKNSSLPSKPVAITIDDGFKSTYTLAYPILKRYNFPATFFIYTDFIEKNRHSLTWEEIKEMTGNNIEIGSHTLSHPNLLEYRKGENYNAYFSRIKEEIFLSKKILEEKINTKIKYFAYPYGTYDSTIKNLVIQAGYKAIFNANSMNNDNSHNPFTMNRQIIFGQNSFDSFIGILNQHLLPVSEIFPADGSVGTNQFIKIGACLNDENIIAKTLSMKLGGAKVKFKFNPKNQEISFTPV